MNAMYPGVMNRMCKNTNWGIRIALEQGLGFCVPDIHVNRTELYQKDGVHLSEEGLDIFLGDLQQGLQKALDLLVGTRA